MAQGVLYARVGNAWVPIGGGGMSSGGGGGADEVFVGPEPPTGPEEMWYDTDATDVVVDDPVHTWNSSWGIVAVGSLSGTDGQAITIPAGSQRFGLTKPLSCTFVSGRRYRAETHLRAWGAQSESGMAQFTAWLVINGADVKTDPWLSAAQSWSNALFHTDFTCPTNVAAGPGTAQIVVSDQDNKAITIHRDTDANGSSSFVIIDMGPTAAFAPPVNPTPAWIPGTFLNGWRNYGDIYQTFQYRKIGDVVSLRGLVAGGTAAAITTLPEGYRPPAALIFPADVNSAAHARIDLYANGSLSTLANNVYVSLTGISFSVSP